MGEVGFIGKMKIWNIGMTFAVTQFCTMFCDICYDRLSLFILSKYYHGFNYLEFEFNFSFWN